MTTIVLSFTDEEFAILEDSLLDVEDYFHTHAAEKLANSKQSLLQRWSPVLKTALKGRGETTIVLDDDERVTLILGEGFYKNRASREAEASLPFEL